MLRKNYELNFLKKRREILFNSNKELQKRGSLVYSDIQLLSKSATNSGKDLIGRKIEIFLRQPEDYKEIKSIIEKRRENRIEKVKNELELDLIKFKKISVTYNSKKEILKSSLEDIEYYKAKWTRRLTEEILKHKPKLSEVDAIKTRDVLQAELEYLRVEYDTLKENCRIKVEESNMIIV